MSEIPLEQVLPEQDFLAPLGQQAEGLEGIRRSLLDAHGQDRSWTRRHYFNLYSEAEAMEAFLDDFGARYNRTYHFLTELVASLRGLSMAGFGLQHVLSRLEGYGVAASFSDDQRDQLFAEIEQARDFLHESLCRLLEGLGEEWEQLGVQLAEQVASGEACTPPPAKLRLPRNVGQEEPLGEEQRIAEVATKYIQACGMLEELGLRRIDEPQEREAFLASRCSEERNRVYEATVHNLQSAYDTFIKNTVMEARDERLPRLRGHVSVALHLLEVTTQLTHFVERHESEDRSQEAVRRLSAWVSRKDVRDVTLNVLLYWANQVMQAAVPIAEELLPNYIDLSELEVQLDADLILHARPASLIVGIVTHHGTPVEMEVEGDSCNAGSILEMMVTVGTYPEAKTFRFRGDAGPLRDIQMLFEHGVGERGLEGLPASLDYLRG